MQGNRFIMLLLAPLALCALTISQQAQVETPPEEQPELLRTTKVYDLSGLTSDELSKSADAGKSLDWLGPDRVMQPMNFSEQGFDWQMRNSVGGARAWPDINSLMSAAFELCNTGDEETHWAIDAAGSTQAMLTCTEEMHRRFSWVIETLRSTAAIKVRFHSYTLLAQSGIEPCLPASEASKLAKSGTLLGSETVPLAECAMFQRLKLQEFVQGFSSDTEVPVAPVTAQLATGCELVCAALLLPDGRVWVHGWAATQNLISLRSVETAAGAMELPRVKYGYAPFSAMLENRGGLIIDEGSASRTLIVCEVEGTMPNRTLECGTRYSLGLVNITGMLVAESAGFSWLPGGESEGHLLELGRSLDAGGHNGSRGYALSGASTRLAEGLAAVCENLGAVMPFGPYLGLRISQPERDSGAPPPDEFERAHKELAATLALVNTGPPCTSLRIRTWQLDGKSPVPENILSGKPTLSQLQGLGVAGFDRCVAALAGQTIELVDLELAARMIQTSRAGLLSWGTQARLTLRVASDNKFAFQLRLGMAEGDRKLEMFETGKATARSKHERSARRLAQGEINGELGVGEALCCVVPAPAEEGWLVIALQRLR